MCIKRQMEYMLCAKAFVRNGIEPQPVSSAEGCPVAIRIAEDGTYRLLEDGQETMCVNKIEHLLRCVVPAITKHQITAIRESAEMNQYE